MKSRILSHSAAALLATVIIAGSTSSAHATTFTLTDLVTDSNANLTALGLPAAAHEDPHLINPWGISFGAASPFWISDNATGVSTLYSAAGVPAGGPPPLVVTIAPPPGAPAGFIAAPTGTVFNNKNTDFFVTNPATGARGSANFLFATEDGTISGRSNAAASDKTFIGVDNSASGAVYKGLAVAPDLRIGHAGHNVIFASNFSSGMVEEYDSGWNFVQSFTDPLPPPVPAGTPKDQNWAPFNVQVLNGRLYVSYALQDADHGDDVAGAGNGFVDVFTTDGVLVQRLVDVGGALDSPWGLAIAPAGFGTFANDLLVGNFGNGEINAFNAVTGAFVGTLTDPHGEPIDLPGLWALSLGNAGAGVDPNAIYFTAGLPLASNPDDLEKAGVFGLLRPAPEPSTVVMFLAGLAGMFWFARKRVAPGIAA